MKALKVWQIGFLLIAIGLGAGMAYWVYLLVLNGSGEASVSNFAITSTLCSDEQGPDCANLRLGDDYLTTSVPAKGYLY